MIKVVTVFLVSAAAFFCIFYFYSADIFECRVVEANPYAEGGQVDYTVDASLKTALFGTDLPQEINSDTFVKIGPTWKGIMILFVCLIGLPAMIAWRSIVKRPAPEENE